MLGCGWARSGMASSLGPVAGVSRCSVVGCSEVVCGESNAHLHREAGDLASMEGSRDALLFVVEI